VKSFASGVKKTASCSRRKAVSDGLSTHSRTRSGKIMRRVLKAQALGQPLGDLSTLED